MPIYEYQAKSKKTSCAKCIDCFDTIQLIAAPHLTNCPDCGGPVVRIISAPFVGASKSGFDDRAKTAGFQKWKKLGSGEYEKHY
jgi:putative FmdB family regulatory protein